MLISYRFIILLFVVGITDIIAMEEQQITKKSIQQTMKTGSMLFAKPQLLERIKKDMQTVFKEENGEDACIKNKETCSLYNNLLVVFKEERMTQEAIEKTINVGKQLVETATFVDLIEKLSTNMFDKIYNQIRSEKDKKNRTVFIVGYIRGYTDVAFIGTNDIKEKLLMSRIFTETVLQ